MITKEQLIALINTNLPDNLIGLINPEATRETLYGMVDKIFNIGDDIEGNLGIYIDNKFILLEGDLFEQLYGEDGLEAHLNELEAQLDILDGNLEILDNALGILDDKIYGDNGLNAHLEDLDDNLNLLDVVVNGPGGLTYKLDILELDLSVLDEAINGENGLVNELQELDNELSTLTNIKIPQLENALEGLDSQLNDEDGLASKLNILDQNLDSLDERIFGESGLESQLNELDVDLENLDDSLFGDGGLSDKLSELDDKFPIDSPDIKDSAITTSKFASGLSVPEIVDSLPSTSLFDGRLIFYTVDKKLYRYDGNEQEWTVEVDGADIIANSITAGQISAGAIGADQIASNAIVSEKIHSDAITAEKIKAGAIEAGHITSNAITSDKIEANAIVASKIATDAITTNKIEANAITANKIATGAITANKIDVNDLAASEAFIESLVATELFAETLVGEKAFIDEITSSTGFFEELISSDIWANEITANSAFFNAISSDTLWANKITANYINVDSIVAYDAFIESLVANSILTGELVTNTAFVESLAADSAFIIKLVATDAFIEDLTARELFADELTANSAFISNITSDDILTGTLIAGRIDVDTLVTRNAWMESVTAEEGWFEEVTSSEAFFDRLFTNSLYIDGWLAAKSIVVSSDLSNYPTKEVAQGYVNALDNSLGFLAKKDDIGVPDLNATIIDGDTIITSLINTRAIAVGDLKDGVDYEKTINLKKGAYLDSYEEALNGVTLISSGFIKTELLDVETLAATKAFIEALFAENIDVTGKIELGDPTTVIISKDGTPPPIKYYTPNPVQNGTLTVNRAQDSSTTPIQTDTLSYINVNKANITVVALYDLDITNSWAGLTDVEVQLLGRKDSEDPVVINSNHYDSLDGISLENEYLVGNTFDYDEISVRLVVYNRTYVFKTTTIEITNLKVNQQSSSIALNADGLYQRVSPDMIIPYGTGGGSIGASVGGDHSLLTNLDKPSDHPWALQNDFSNILSKSGARSALDVYSKSESNSRFLQTSNKLSELSEIAGTKTFLSSVNIGKSGAGNDADLHVWGDIIQHGSAYETHVEKIYTTKDFITTRDGAVAGLGAGEISGIRALLADGTNNIILGVDNSGLFRVGKENGTLVALAGREDSPTQGGIPYWDGSANNIFKTSGNATLDGAGNAEFAGILNVGGEIRRHLGEGQIGMAIRADNNDVSIWRVRYNSFTSTDYGFDLRYLGTGTANENLLRLITDNATGTPKTVYDIWQDGTIKFYEAAEFAKKLTTNSLEVSTTSLLKGLVTTENEIVLGKQASGSTHAVRADRTLTLKGDAPISFDTESARNLTANRTWTASLASQDPLFIDSGKLAVKEHGSGQTGTLNTSVQDIYGAKTFKDDTLFAGTIGSPSYLWGVTPEGVAHFDEFTARALMVEDFKANTNLVFSGKHTLTKSVGILERAWRVPLSENFVDSVTNWTPISYTNWGSNISGYIPVIAGQKYYFSAEIRNLVGAEVRVRLQTFDSSQNLVRDNINANYIQDNGVTSSTAVIADGEAYISLVWRKIDGSSQTSYEYRNLLVVLGDSTPQPLYISAPNGWMEGQVFEDGDFVRVPVVNRAAGLRLGDAWGTVRNVQNQEGNLLYNSTFNLGDDGWQFTSSYMEILPPEADKPNSAIMQIDQDTGLNTARYSTVRIPHTFVVGEKITMAFDFKYHDWDALQGVLITLRRADAPSGGTVTDLASQNKNNMTSPPVEGQEGEWNRVYHTYTVKQSDVDSGDEWLVFGLYRSTTGTDIIQFREIDVYLGDYDPEREYQPQGAIQKYEFTPRRVDDAVKGLTAGAGTTAMSVGSADNPVAMITDDVISQDAPFTSITSWTGVPWNDGTGNITDIIRTGNLAGLNNPNVVGDGIFGRNAYFTGKLLVGDLSKTNNYLEYNSLANSGLGALKIKTNTFDLTAGNGDHWKTADNSFQFGGESGISFGGDVNDKIIHGSNSLFKGLVEIGSGNNIFKADGDLGIWLGHANMASAPFSVTRAGVLKARSGSIGGADIGNYNLKYTTGVLAAYVGDATPITNGNISGGTSDTGFVIGRTNNYIGMATDPYGDDYVMKALISGNEVFRLGSAGNRIAGAYFDDKGMWAGSASKANARILFDFANSTIDLKNDGHLSVFDSQNIKRVSLDYRGLAVETTGEFNAAFNIVRALHGSLGSRGNLIGQISGYDIDGKSLMEIYVKNGFKAGVGDVPGELRLKAEKITIETTKGSSEQGLFINLDGIPTSNPLQSGQVYLRTASQLGGSGSEYILCISPTTVSPPGSAPVMSGFCRAGLGRFISVSWTAVAGADNYEIYLNDALYSTTPSLTAGIQLGGSASEKVQVRAVNVGGKGPFSVASYIDYDNLPSCT